MLVEQFVTWATNAERCGMTFEKLNAPLPLPLLNREGSKAEKQAAAERRGVKRPYPCEAVNVAKAAPAQVVGQVDPSLQLKAETALHQLQKGLLLRETRRDRSRSRCALCKSVAQLLSNGASPRNARIAPFRS